MRKLASGEIVCIPHNGNSRKIYNTHPQHPGPLINVFPQCLNKGVSNVQTLSVFLCQSHHDHPTITKKVETGS